MRNPSDTNFNLTADHTYQTKNQNNLNLTLENQKQTQQNTQQNIQLNVQTTKILEKLNTMKSLEIVQELNPCVELFKMCTRNFTVYPLQKPVELQSTAQNQEQTSKEEPQKKELGEPLFIASQDGKTCCSLGYMLLYKLPDSTIFGSLGYLLINDCCKCDCCKCECCKCDFCCSCCEQKCCENGGCFLGGCCIYAGCCCCCPEPCCVGGCCKMCDCYCFEGGCCKEPCCEYGCCPCPDCVRLYLDVRFLNTMEEALDINGGLYVGTVNEPFSCCNNKFGYHKVGERFELTSCGCTNSLEIFDNKKQACSGSIKWDVCRMSSKIEYEVNFPEDATAMEKLMILSSFFMFDYEASCSLKKEQKIYTRKYRNLQGIDANFK